MFFETIERRANGLTRGWVNSTEIVRVLDEGPDDRQAARRHKCYTEAGVGGTAARARRPVKAA